MSEAMSKLSKSVIAACWRPRVFGLFFIFAVASIAVAWRFSPWMSHVFYGDDLSYLLSFYDGSCGTKASEILFSACSEKFRPLASGFILLMFNLFNANVAAYLAVNVVLLGLSATLVYAISHRLGAGWKLSLAISLTVVISRFAAYIATQMIGPVEGLALPLFLGMIYSIIRAGECRESAWKWCWIGILLAFLTILTHERYIVVSVWLFLAFLLLPNIRNRSRMQLSVLLFACVSLPVIYIGYKLLVLDVSFLIGTGGTHIKFDLTQILQHLLQAVTSIFGFNHGPAYLVGADLTSLPRFPAWFLAISFSLSWLVLVVMGVRNSFMSEHKASVQHPLIWPLLLLMLGGALLVPAVLTIRLEQRWIYASFILLMFLFPLALHRQRMPFYGSLLLAVMCFASATLDGVIMKHFNQLYFAYAAHFAELVKRDIIDSGADKSSSIVFFTGADNCHWTLQKGGFFRIYGGEKRQVRCFNSVDESLSAAIPLRSKFYRAGPQHLIDITDNWYVQKHRSNSKVIYDFLASFLKGQINSELHVSSPNGMGVFPLQLEGALGKRKTLVVVSGFSYRFDGINVDRDMDLSFEVSMVYPSVEAARVNVTIAEQGGRSVHVFSRDLFPPHLGAKLHFIPVSISLSDFIGKRISVSFAAATPGHHPNGHWIAFANPVIVER